MLLGERERVIEPLEVGELVTEQLAVPELLGVCTCVGLEVTPCVGLIDSDAVEVVLRVGSADAVDDWEPVAAWLVVTLAVNDWDGVAVSDAACVPESVALGVACCDAVGEGVPDNVLVMLPVAEDVATCEEVCECVPELNCDRD